MWKVEINCDKYDINVNLINTGNYVLLFSHTFGFEKYINIMRLK